LPKLLINSSNKNPEGILNSPVPFLPAAQAKEAFNFSSQCLLALDIK
jgi:hypothetical protein